MIVRQLKLNQILKKDTSTFLFGARGVGKTQLVKEFLSNIKNSYYIDLLDLEIRRRYFAQPGLLRQEIESLIKPDQILTVVIDEIQGFPELLNEVHRSIEVYKKKVRFILTGSSARKLKKDSANMLAGRAWTLHLHPFCSTELNLDINKAMQFGTLPSVYLNEDPERKLRSYVDTYLKEEILQESLIRKLEAFSRFLEVAGQYNSEPVNFSKTAKLCRVNPSTIQDYYSILSDTLISHRINAWNYSVSRQISQAPKYYFFDCGVLNTITGEIRTELRPSSYRYGKLFETFVIQEIIRLNDYFDTQFKFFYWRTSTGQEVDIILSRGARDIPLAIEIKSSSSPKAEDLKSLILYSKDYPKAKLFCLCQTIRPYKLENNITVLPWRDGANSLLQQ